MGDLRRTVALFTAICFLLASCSKVLYKHQDFMNKMKTKQDVQTQFGYPNEYKIQDEKSEWFYDLENQKK